MQNRKTLSSNSGFDLLQVDDLDENAKIKRTSYEVSEPDGNVTGRFGSLTEAQSFIKLLCRLSPQS